MWYCKKINLIVFSISLNILASCGFKPLYSNPGYGPKINGHVNVLNVRGKEGFHLREDLIRRFGNPLNGAYKLKISLDISRVEEVITPTNEITSYSLIMTANYTLKDSMGTLVIPKQITTARTGFSSAINSSGYATQVAEEAAKKRLALKIGENINNQLVISSEKWLE